VGKKWVDTDTNTGRPPVLKWRRKMPTSEELKQEASKIMHFGLGIPEGICSTDINRMIDCIIEAAVMKAVEKMKEGK